MADSRMTEWVTSRYGVLRVPRANRADLADVELRNLLPRSKQDIKRVKGLMALGYPAIAPVLPELLTWLQDINWPIAEPVSLLLATVGAPLVPHARKVLEGDDDLWKTGVLISFQDVPEIVGPLSSLIARIALRPTPGEIEDGTSEAASYVLSLCFDE